MPEPPYLPAGQPLEGRAAQRETGAPTGTPEALPWWWVVLFLIMFVVFAGVVVVLVAQGQSLPIAVGVPATLSAVVLGALSRLAVLARRRQL